MDLGCLIASFTRSSNRSSAFLHPHIPVKALLDGTVVHQKGSESRQQLKQFKSNLRKDTDFYLFNVTSLLTGFTEL